MIDKKLLDRFNFKYDEKANKIYIEKTIGEGEETKTINETIISPVPEVMEFITDTKDRMLTLKVGEEIQRIAHKELFIPGNWEQLFIEERVKVINNKKYMADLVYILTNSKKDTWKKEINFFGIDGDKFIIPGTTIDKNLTINKNQFYSNSNILDFDIPNEVLTDEEKELLKDLLPKFRGLEGPGWFSACFYNHDKINFPILSSFGTTGKGKTFGMEVLSNINFSSSVISFETLTLAQARRHLDITNLMPLIVDDFKRGEKNKKVEIEPLLRAVFQGGKSYQATISKEMVEFNLRRPMAITGENPLINISSNNRMIDLEMKNLDKKDLNKLLKNDCIILKKLGLELLKERLNFTNEDVKELHRKGLNDFRNRFEDSDIEDRILENYSIINLGLVCLDKVLNTNWSKNYNFIDRMRTGIKTFNDQLMEWILTAIDCGKLDLKEFQTKERKNEPLKFHTTAFFEMVLSMVKDKIITIEEMDLKDFRMKLESCNNVELKKSLKIGTKNNTGFIFNVNDYFWNEVRKRTTNS